MVEAVAVVSVADKLMAAGAFVVVGPHEERAACRELAIEKVFPFGESIVEMIDIEHVGRISEIVLQRVHRVDGGRSGRTGISRLHGAAGIKHQLRHGLFRGLRGAAAVGVGHVVPVEHHRIEGGHRPDVAAPVISVGGDGLGGFLRPFPVIHHLGGGRCDATRGTVGHSVAVGVDIGGSHQVVGIPLVPFRLHKGFDLRLRGEARHLHRRAPFLLRVALLQ